MPRPQRRKPRKVTEMTVQKFNPNEQDHITLTKVATDYIKQCIEKRGSGIGLRVSVNKAGCSGLKYQVDFVEFAEPNDLVHPIDDKLAVFIDKDAVQYIQGTVLDYVTEGLNKKLIFKNPNETSSCGCGESFTVE